jgi:superfamily II DNA/RNA helicase
VVYGGASRGPQAGQLRRVPDIVIATPGRLLDFIENGEADLTQVGRGCRAWLDQGSTIIY